jgi:hypothetical protein
VDFQARFESWTKDNFSLSDYGKKIFERPFIERSFSLCMRGAFMISKRGYVGLAPKKTQLGDLLCILRRGETPFILRQIMESYSLVGEVYVHGIMNREGVQIAKPRDLREFRLK